MKVRNALCPQHLLNLCTDLLVPSWLVCKFDLIMFGMEIFSNAHVGTASVLDHFLSHFGGLLLCWTYILYFLFWAGIAIFYGYGWNSRHRSDRVMSFQEESKFCLPPFVLDPHYWVWMWNQVQGKVISRIFGALHQVSDGEVGKFVVEELCIQWWTWKCGIFWKCVKQFYKNVTFVDN